MRQKNFLKLTAATFAIIGAGAFLFSAAAETAMAASAGTVETVPTSYQVSASQAATKSLQSAASPLPGSRRLKPKRRTGRKRITM